MRVPIYIALAMLLTSCSAHRVVESSQRDSIRIEVVERLVPVHDTVTVEIPHIVEVAKVCQDSSRLANKFARSEAIILPTGELHHSLETIPQSITQPVEVETIVRDSIVYRNKEVVEVVEVEKILTKWQQFQMSGFWLLLIIVIIYCIILRVVRLST